MTIAELRWEDNTMTQDELARIREKMIGTLRHYTVSSGSGVCEFYQNGELRHFDDCPGCNGTGHTKVVEKTIGEIIKEAIKCQE